MLAESKPAGAYRPPGARGTAASDAYSRDYDAAAADTTPTFRGGKPAQRYVPGTVPGAPKPSPADDKKKKSKSKKGPKENGVEPVANGTSTPPVEEMSNLEVKGGEPDEAAAKKLRGLKKKVRCSHFGSGAC